MSTLAITLIRSRRECCGLFRAPADQDLAGTFKTAGRLELLQPIVDLRPVDLQRSEDYVIPA